MVPQINRSEPAYVQVAKALREQIIDGRLPDGAVMPSMREIAESWGVSRATAEKALSVLRAEGLVSMAVGRGTVVTLQDQGHSPGDWSARLRRTGQFYPPGETERILVAELVTAPEHVAAALGLEPEAPAIRRQRQTYRNEAPDIRLEVSTSWLDGTLAQSAPRLLELEGIEETAQVYAARSLGLTITHGRDQVYATSATGEHAELLGVPEGSPVLAGQWWTYAADEVIQFGEFVARPNRRSTYDYLLS
jgi:DNA-binding GntR family transcriptional regulator